ncbi:hypothetical protein ES705_21038 [subsurface metagenome]
MRFTQNQLKEAVHAGNAEADIFKSYLGYITIRDLPDAIFGPSLLEPPSKDLLNNKFITREYLVNIFGIEKKIKTLAFQEQDKTVSACSTTALWSAFHKTSELFKTPVPSPSEITKSAGNIFTSHGRAFPSKGLDFFQICNSIENFGLVSEMRNKESFFEDDVVVRGFIYSYLKFGLPVLLAIKIDGLRGGHHLITLTGYSKTKAIPLTYERVSLESEKVGECYSHDDQVGPYSRIKFLSKGKITTFWPKADGKGYRNATCLGLIVPIHPKVRLNFEIILAEINKVYSVLGILVRRPELWIFDIYLELSNNYKENLLSPAETSSLTEQIVFDCLPKYIWVAAAHLSDELKFEFIFDATDVIKGFHLLHWRFVKSQTKSQIRSKLKESVIQELIKMHLGEIYLEFFLESVGIKYG